MRRVSTGLGMSALSTQPGRKRRLLIVEALGRLTLEAELGRAIDRNELQLHYQPKLCPQLGLRIAVDDFGIGYSNLSLLGCSRFRSSRSIVLSWAM
jgi:predicted signal transduction protein with EAL and GGDEF domain